MIDRRALLFSGAAAAAAGWSAPAAAHDAFAPVIARIRAFVADDALPFAALRVARHGRVLAEAHVSGVEPVGPQTIYRIYSMTKPVIAAGTVLLVEDGRLDLETPVADIVPEFADMKVVGASLDQLEPARPMTVAHLLTHTCGLGNSWGATRTAPLYRQAGLTAAAWMYDPEIGGLDGFARRLGALPLEAQPGATWIYGYGLDVAGLVIQRVSGQRLGDFLNSRIFAPLGMNSTGFHVAEGQGDRLAGLYTLAGGVRVKVQNGGENAPLVRPIADAGSGGLVSTLEDYGRFADMLAGWGQTGGRDGGVRVMTPETARLLMTPYGPQDHIAPALGQFGVFGLGGTATGVGQALGGITRLSPDPAAEPIAEYAWGGAASTIFWSSPGTGVSVTMMTQLMPSGAVPVRDTLRPLVAEALATAH